jgi:hypothetical protein
MKNLWRNLTYVVGVTAMLVMMGLSQYFSISQAGFVNWILIVATQCSAFVFAMIVIEALKKGA